MSYVGPTGRKGVDAGPFRKLFAEIVQRCGGNASEAGRLCGFPPTRARAVLVAERIEHVTGRKILEAWRRMKAGGAT